MTSNRTRLTRTEEILKQAELNGWRMARNGSVHIFYCPPNLKGKMMEPQVVEVLDVDGYLSADPSDHCITTTISDVTGRAVYDVTGGAAFRAIKNTGHPLRTRQFFTLAGGMTDAELCKVQGVSETALKNSKLRGYMSWRDADKFAVKLLKVHPAYVWGGDEWIRCHDEKWS